MTDPDRRGSPSKLPACQIIAVGSELLTPTRLDTNSLFLTEEVNRLGIEVDKKTVVGDREDKISSAIRRAVESAALLFVTGGLGPTKDDITREVVAKLFERRLIFDPAIMESIEARARKFSFPLAENNRRQAMVPEGAEVLPNSKGTAPGLLLRVNRTLVFLLPGPPRELKPMVTGQVVGILEKTFPVSVQLSRHLSVASMAESRVDALVEPIYSLYPDIQTTILSSPGIIHLHLRYAGSSAAGNSMLEELIGRIRTTLGDSVFSETGQALPQVVGETLQGNGLNLATAESCTGGLIGKLITDVPGSSDYFKGSVVVYSDDLKETLLGLPSSILETEGAVSDPVARYMARSVCELTGASASLSATGVAGPGGGTDEKPVGLVFLGLCLGDQVFSSRHLLPGGRQTIRLRAALLALDWLRRKLL